MREEKPNQRTAGRPILSSASCSVLFAAYGAGVRFIVDFDDLDHAAETRTSGAGLTLEGAIWVLHVVVRGQLGALMWPLAYDLIGSRSVHVARTPCDQ